MERRPPRWPIPAEWCAPTNADWRRNSAAAGGASVLGLREQPRVTHGAARYAANSCRRNRSAPIKPLADEASSGKNPAGIAGIDDGVRSPDVAHRRCGAPSPALRPPSAECFIRSCFSFQICRSHSMSPTRGFELLAIVFIRYRLMKGSLPATILQVIVGGGLVFALGLLLGKIGAA
jgi:hypothetical protein